MILQALEDRRDPPSLQAAVDDQSGKEETDEKRRLEFNLRPVPPWRGEAEKKRKPPMNRTG